MACQWEGAAVVQRAGISQRTAVRPGLHSSQWDLSEQARRSVHIPILTSYLPTRFLPVLLSIAMLT